MVSFIQGGDPLQVSSLVFECVNCGRGGLATTYLPPVDRDRTLYSIFLPQQDVPSPKNISALHRLKPMPVLLAKTLLQRGSIKLLGGRAYEVIELIRKLTEAGVEFSVEPRFPFDMEGCPISVGELKTL
jgi:hypothetical protein